MKETVFEKLARSVPVNKATALQISHAEPEELREYRKLELVRVNYNLAQVKGPYLPDQDLLAEYMKHRAACEREAERLGFPVFKTKKRPHSMEYFAVVEGVLHYRVRLLIGILECATFNGRRVFRYRSPAFNVNKLYMEGQLLADTSTATAEQKHLLQHHKRRIGNDRTIL